MRGHGVQAWQAMPEKVRGGTGPWRRQRTVQMLRGTPPAPAWGDSRPAHCRAARMYFCPSRAGAIRKLAGRVATPGQDRAARTHCQSMVVGSAPGGTRSWLLESLLLARPARHQQDSQHHPGNPLRRYQALFDFRPIPCCEENGLVKKRQRRRSPSLRSLLESPWRRRWGPSSQPRRQLLQSMSDTACTTQAHAAAEGSRRLA